MLPADGRWDLTAFKELIRRGTVS